MKKIFFASFLISLLALGNPAASFAQSYFKGQVKYSISYPKKPKMDPAMQAALPSVMTIKVKDNMKKTIVPMSVMTQVEITNGDEQSRTVLIDVMGQKIAIKSSKEKIEKEMAENPAPEIEYLNETKKILGYNCKKAKVTYTEKNGSSNSFEIFYTEEIQFSPKLNFDSQLKEIDGLPLEFTMIENDMEMNFKAKEIIDGKVKNSDFKISDDYKFVTEEELKTMFGGM